MKWILSEKRIILFVILISFLLVIGFIVANPTMYTIINIDVINIADDYYMDILAQGLNFKDANTEVASQNGIMLSSSNIYLYDEDGFMAFGLRDSDIRAEFYSPESHEHQFVFYGDYPREFKLILETNSGNLFVSEARKFNGHISNYTYDFKSNDLIFNKSVRSETPFVYFIFQYMLLLIALLIASFLAALVMGIILKLRPLKKLIYRELLSLPFTNIAVLWLLFYTGIPAIVAIMPMFIISGLIKYLWLAGDFEKKQIVIYSLVQLFTATATYSLLIIFL